ncbi:NUDIX domain-containing protein [Nocardia sp. 2]|uniref:NUDIX domain-containing protein n=1 Tax=Nocardia acididurans TaxID=2802282 RepID=A0ABS1M7N2_9NOCA|nr:NUDIX domain-containing protein [Nocardia acididurans]
MVREDAVLLIRRAPGVFLAGRWELPGGGIEPGELPEPRCDSFSPVSPARELRSRPRPVVRR